MTTIRIHTLRSFPASALNCGQDKMPKTLLFGEVTRLRISSQSLKYALRHDEKFQRRLGELVSVHTCALPEMVAEYLEAQTDAAETEIADIAATLTKLGREGKGKKDKEAAPGESESEKKTDGDEGEEKEQPAFRNTATLMAIASHEPQELGDHFLALYRSWGKKKFMGTEIGKLADTFAPCFPVSVDIAAFGRMSTSSAILPVEGAVSVSHSFSVNAAAPKLDFFIGRDDHEKRNKENPILGETGYGSGTFYNCAAINFETLLENLGGDEDLAMRAAQALIEGLILATPGGKHNTMLAETRPDLVLLEAVPDGEALTYANAFNAPVRPDREHSLAEKAAAVLLEYVLRSKEVFGSRGGRAFISMVPLPDDLSLNVGVQLKSLTGLLEWAQAEILARQEAK
jgi:CRISPR system Cascade subunit CasC